MVALLGLVAILVVPAISQMQSRLRMESTARQTAALLQQARTEAINRGVPVVVEIDFTDDTLVAFADIDDALGDPGSDLLFTPRTADDTDDGVEPARGTTDYVVASLQLPGGNTSSQIYFWGAEDSGPEEEHAVSGFTASPNVDEPNLAVFDSDGSIDSVGAFRLGMGPLPEDSPGDGIHWNFMEVRVAPQATGRVEVRKYIPEPPGIQGYYPRDSTPGGASWTWY